MDYVEKNVLALEDDLTEIRDFDLSCQMAKMVEGVAEEHPGEEQRPPSNVHADCPSGTSEKGPEGVDPVPGV